jgi:hypothetical protein
MNTFVSHELQVTIFNALSLMAVTNLSPRRNPTTQFSPPGNHLTNTPEWCFLSALNMKTTFAPTLKHAQTNGYMSIWTRVGCRLGVVGTIF